MEKIARFFTKYEILIPLLLGLFFVFITTPGISWGTPRVWHPDEIVRRVNKSLQGEWQFDETNFDYPSLPKYVMYGVGKIVYGLGQTVEDFIIAARFVSVVLGALVVVLTYCITRHVGGNIATSILAAMFLISNSELGLHAHWAHNDLYVTFFVNLGLFAIIKYCYPSQNRLWLYLSFFTAGLAGSSKYNGGVIVLTPLIMFLYFERNNLRKKALRIVETLFIGFMLSVLGYGLGTPKALLWMAFYFKRLIPALTRHSLYGQRPDSANGVLTQWGMLASFWGWFLFIFLLLAFGYTAYQLGKHFLRNRQLETKETAKLAIVISIVVLDIPILLSYNVQQRFLLPIAPMLAVLGAFLVQDLIAFTQAHQKRALKFAVIGTTAIVIAFSFLRLLSVPLLLLNDSRKAAGEFLLTLPKGGDIEYTLYQPNIPKNHFAQVKSYPLVFLKFIGQATPENRFYELNIGEVGIEERQPDYLIVDSFTADRFNDEYTCSLHPADCAFFKRLERGETNYKLIAAFEYSLPGWIPKTRLSFVNPNIYLYQRTSTGD